MKRGLGRSFEWLWRAYAVSTVGTWLGFGAFAVIAIRVLHEGPMAVSALAAAGPAVGACLAIPFGPWIENRRKRPIMVAMDLIRFGALATVPVAFMMGWLSYVQLLLVSAVVAAAQIAFAAANGAFLKSLLHSDQLLAASQRFESTAWSAAIVGPPAGGAAIGLLGPAITVVVDATSYLGSALGIMAIDHAEQEPMRRVGPQHPSRDLFAGWRYILSHPELRLLFFNNILVGGLILATEPLIAVLMLGRLGFAPWQYGLAFALPCLGGLLGSRLSRPLVERMGQGKVLLWFGAARALWPVGMAFIRPGVEGIVLVVVVQFGLIMCMGIFSPVLAAYQLQQTQDTQVARMLSAWKTTTNASRAVLIGLWGLLAAVTSPRTAIALAGILVLASIFVLPRRGLSTVANTKQALVV